MVDTESLFIPQEMGLVYTRLSGPGPQSELGSEDSVGHHQNQTAGRFQFCSFGFWHLHNAVGSRHEGNRTG